ncbi:uncharacterized protein LOC117344622 [Pecten maximus]|uniref:uncharacterized protein LOC117344622 n=1 Tax=Pecten maximus TaxID=6579 RepID=UPI001458F6A8|nr:uncharacterized protein LOC117344622 [Pecten maximus]XP_033763335.1 uncharacterized protein LOC117344622 [Pecten maximus]
MFSSARQTPETGTRRLLKGGSTKFLVPETSDKLQFKKNVLIGYSDISVAGSRALLGLNMRIEYEHLPIPQMRGCTPLCVRSEAPGVKEQHFQPLQVLQCKYEEYSCVIVNTIVPADKCQHVANTIIDLCIESGVEKVILLTTLKLDKIPDNQLKPLYESTFNTKPVTSKLALPPDTKICDPLLSTLIQMIQIESIPCSCLVVPGHRAMAGKANIYDESQQAILAFHKVLKKWSRLDFSEDLSLSLIYDSLDVEDLSAMSSLMYG